MSAAAIRAVALRTPIGADVRTCLNRLLAGERASRENPRFDASSYLCRIAAPVDTEPGPSPHRRFLSRIGLLAVEAAHEAFTAAGLPAGDRLGLFAGYGGLRAHWEDLMPALERQEEGMPGSWERGLKLLPPFWMLRHLSNNAHALIAQDLSAKGEGVTWAGGNGGAQAISSAIRALQAESIDAALVVAYDCLIEPETLVEMAARGTATTAGPEDLAAPYDEAAAGVVPGEAAAALVLTRQRDGESWARLEAADGAGPGAAAALTIVAKRLARGDEGLVDGAGWARPEVDLAERLAVATRVSSGAALSAISAATGALGAATALVQAILLPELLRRSLAPPVAGLRRATAGPLLPAVSLREIRTRSGLGLSAAAPGLAGAIRVTIP